MPKPRSSQISLEATSYYHCISRCVRRAYLCGTDHMTGESYEHRRSWLEDKLLELSNIFAIDIAAYAIMSNHYHAVLHINAQRAKSWSDQEVAERWHSLFKGTQFSRKFVRGEPLSDAEWIYLRISLDEWRERLTSVSWFMRVLNEAIAREANFEDGCTGRFWEGRFKSQALLDEAALAACMAYVDLNPVRAGMAKTPEKSAHTSVKKRCEQLKKTKQPNRVDQQVKALYPFVGNPKQHQPEGIQMRLTDYLELVDCTGRILRNDKRGAISNNAESILTRLGLDSDQWLEMTAGFEECFKTFAGGEQSLRSACEQLHYQRPTGLSQSQRLFN